MKGEGRLKQKVKRRLEKQAKRYGVEVYADSPPASQYGAQGRPDLYVDFGSIHFRIEVKTETGKLSPTQQVWHHRHDNNHEFIPLFIIAGEDEMDLFFAGFDDTMRQMLSDATAATEQMWVKLNEQD